MASNKQINIGNSTTKVDVCIQNGDIIITHDNSDISIIEQIDFEIIETEVGDLF